MSVIFGIKEENRIIIAGDKRGATSDGNFLTDNLNKVIMINEYLAFVAAGNAAIEKAIQMDVDKIKGKERITIDDLINIIRAFYQKINESGATGILAMPFCFLIAGKSRNNEASLISGYNSKGNLITGEVQMMLYPPADIGIKQCCDIFARNYQFFRSEFVEKTIREISGISQLVSTTGDKWIFNTLTGKGIIHKF